MKFFFGFLFSVISLTSFGQSNKFTFKLGSEYELPNKSEDLAFFGNEQDGIVNLSLKNQELIIVRFDPKSLRQLSERRIDLPMVTKNFNNETLIDFNNKNYYWLHSDWDKKSRREMLFYEKIDVNKGRIIEPNRLLIESDKIGGDKGWDGNLKTIDKFKYDYSADRNFLLISYKLAPELRSDKKNFDVIGLNVFDNKMKKIWGGEFTMPFTELYMKSFDYSVDSYGNAYLLAKKYDVIHRKDRNNNKGAASYHFEILKFTKGSSSFTTTPIAIEDGFIKEATLIENQQHQMIVACTYGKKSRGNGTDGIFLAILGQNGEISKFKNGYFEFPKEELQKYESARRRRKIEKNDDYESQNLKVRDVMLAGDGGIFITCEEFYVTENVRTSNAITYYTLNFHYNDIIASKLNANGNFEWMRKIPKYQIGTNSRGTMGFKLISDASGYYFLYLDNKKNLQLPEDHAPKLMVDGLNGHLIVVKLDQKGNLTKDLLFDTGEEDMKVFPADFSQINNNQFIGRAKLKKTLFQPVLVTMK